MTSTRLLVLNLTRPEKPLPSANLVQASFLERCNKVWTKMYAYSLFRSKKEKERRREKQKEKETRRKEKRRKTYNLGFVKPFVGIVGSIKSSLPCSTKRSYIG